jgi:hypothetical protein
VIDGEAPVLAKGQNFIMKSIAQFSGGLCDGIANREKYFDQ